MTEGTHLIITDSSATVPGGPAIPKKLRYRTLIVPRNSGIQSVASKISRAMVIAQSFKSDFRPFAEKLVDARDDGLISLSSEGGALLQELNTTRHKESLNYVNTGPPVTPWDKWLHGKQFGKNNPEGRDPPLM